MPAWRAGRREASPVVATLPPLMRRAKAAAAAWDLSALLNTAAHAAQPRSTLAERHLWLIRMLEWLRHAPLARADDAGDAAAAATVDVNGGTGTGPSLSPSSPRRGAADGALPGPGTATRAAAPPPALATAAKAATAVTAAATPRPLLRLKHLLNVLDRHPEHHAAVAALLARFWQEVDAPALFADFGFSPRSHFFGELAHRLKLKLLPATPVTTDLGELFPLLFPHDADAVWLDAVDAPTLARLIALLHAAPPALASGGSAVGPPAAAQRADWRLPLLDAILFLASHVRSVGFSVLLRQRMRGEPLAGQPFRQLGRVVEQLREQLLAGDQPALLREAQYLRAVLDGCRRSADSVLDHLQDNGVSIDIVFEVDQLRERTHRIEQLLNCALSPQPALDVGRLLADLVRTASARRSVRALFASHYSLLARKVVQRSAATGEHYITRDRREYAAMLRAAAGGGAVIAGTTFAKFAVLALGMSAFWGGFWAGVNYAASFLLVHLLHWTVATKQPAMTAPAMAEKLNDVGSYPAERGAEWLAGAGAAVDDGGRRHGGDTTAAPPASAVGQDAAAIERFVDEVANLIRSQAAGIFGNLCAVFPLVLAVQWGTRAAFGAPLVGVDTAGHVVDSLGQLAPTVLFAAFTGVLLFGSSLIAGWVENWFVWQRLDTAIAWNPRIVARLGQARAQRWSRWWRLNVAGVASNVSLGLMLGIVPVVARFFGLPLDVRHITLSTGQLAAALGAEGFGPLAQAPFWWCVLGIAATGALNVGVSFFLAFKVALRSRGTRRADRSRLYRAIRRRLRQRPASFILPPRRAAAAPAPLVG